MSSPLEFPGMTSMQMTLSYLLACLWYLDMERSHGEEGVEGKCKKVKGCDLQYRCEPLQSSGETDFPCAVCHT